MDRSKYGVIIPAFNEAQTIASVVKSALRFGTVIVVNDCSSDETGSIAEASGAVLANHDLNKGYEGALNTGFLKASELGLEIVITLDADGQHDASVIDNFFNTLKDKKAMCVCGVRPGFARFSEKMFAVYFKLRFGIQDPLCGFKCYNMDLWKQNLSKFSDFNSIGTSLLFLSCKNNFKVIQIPISIQDRSDSSRFGNVLKANMKILRALFSILKRDFSKC